MERQAKQQEKEFGIITKAKDLVKHTDMMTSERRFPKKYRFTLVNRMQDRALFIYECVQEANELDLNDPQECRERLHLQRKALTACKILLFFVELAFEKERIDEAQCEAWAQKILDVKYMTATWNKKDRERVAAQNRPYNRNPPRQAPAVFLGVCLITSNSYNARHVNSSGVLSNNNAYNGNHGARPLRWKTANE